MVGDERHRFDEVLGVVFWAFGLAVAETMALGIAGGLWLSTQSIKRIDAMRATAQEIMAGDLSRRIPSEPIHDDLSALAQTFNRMFERMEKLLLANKQVSATAAHDLRKPLSRVLGRLETRHEAASSDADRGAIAASIADVERVLETFNALLRIAEIEAGARRVGFRPLDLAEIARDVVESFQPAADDAGKEIVARLDSPLLLRGDKELLTQMAANLLDNAVQYTAPGARIEVFGERTSFGVSLQVADNGPGVAPQEMKALFGQFYRPEAARKSGGTGLGLNIVSAIAELHGLKCSARDNHPGLLVIVATASKEE
jgi:signal transduction histidine kinase